MAVADNRVYLVPPEVTSEIASRLVGAWDNIRIQTCTLELAEGAGDHAGPARQGALPGQ